MQVYCIMGSHPGDGGVIKAKNFKEAAIQYFAADSGIAVEEVRKEVDERWEMAEVVNEKEMQFGAYTIREVQG